MTEQETLTSEYFLLYRVAEAMYRLLQDIGYDVCGNNCSGTCPLCVARQRFAPQRPCVVLRTSVVER